jgi:hypothetical protein
MRTLSAPTRLRSPERPGSQESRTERRTRRHVWQATAHFTDRCVLNDCSCLKAILYHLHVLISCSILEPQRQFMYETAISWACIQRGPGMLLEHGDRCLEHNGRCIARRRGTKGVLIFCFFPLDKASSWGKGGFCLRYLRLCSTRSVTVPFPILVLYLVRATCNLAKLRIPYVIYIDLGHQKISLANINVIPYHKQRETVTTLTFLVHCHISI